MADRPLSVLHIFPSFSIGGQQRRLASLAAAFGETFRHRIITLDGDSAAAALFEERPSVETLLLEKSGGIVPRNIAMLRRAIAASGADLLCTYNFGSIEAAIANRLGPRLAHVHHEDGFGPDEAGGAQKKKRVLARRFLLSRARVVTPSFEMEKIARDVWRLSPAQIRRIPVGVDVAAFNAVTRKADGAVTIGALGGLRAEKNIERLIRCFENADGEGAARLVIVGDGPERAALEARARQGRAAARIAFAGATTDPAAAFAGFDVFALSSDTEQMPTSLIEAMASGLPFVATDVGDVRRIAGEENADSVIAASDETAFAARLGALIADAPLRARLGAANRVRARQFDQAAMIEAFRALYGEAAKNAGPAR